MTMTDDRGALEVLTLVLDDQLFAVEASQVIEILDLVPITEVPGARAFAGGLINVRGRVVPLTDIRLPLNLQPLDASMDTRIVVAEITIEGEATIVGIIADQVREVTQIAAAAREDTPRIGTRWRPELIRCLGKIGAGFVAVLDLERIFTEAMLDKPRTA